jgi:hypothetical protein
LGTAGSARRRERVIHCASGWRTQRYQSEDPPGGEGGSQRIELTGGFRRWSKLALFLKAASAENGSSLGGLEWNSSFGSALRTGGSGFGAHLLISAHAFCFALLAALGIIFELLVVKKDLLTGGEYKFSAAVDARQDSIGKFHGRLPRSKDIQPKSAMDCESCRSRFLVSVRDTPRARAA